MNGTTRRKIVFYPLFIISTLITLIILYTNTTSFTAYVYVVMYAIFLVVFLMYFVIVAIIQLTRLGRGELLKRIRTFSMYFVLFAVVTFTINFVSQSPISNVTNTLTIACGLALGISFFDLLFKKI